MFQGSIRSISGAAFLARVPASGEVEHGFGEGAEHGVGHEHLAEGPAAFFGADVVAPDHELEHDHGVDAA